jgi:hypothetical protein
MRTTAYNATAAPTAATVWLLSTTANVLSMVPSVAAHTTKIRPQSVVPYFSTSRASKTNIRAIGKMLIVTNIARPISYGYSRSVAPLNR